MRNTSRFSADRLAQGLLDPEEREIIKMILIQAATNPSGITVVIDGQLIGDYVAEVEASIRKSMEQCKDVRLFLRNVSHIDETGHALLSQLAAQGVELSATGLYSSHVVAEVQLALMSQRSGRK
jgi:ABC-type transporter Mla MlaB component